MKATGISRRHFFFGSLLAGAVPAGGWGAVPGLGRLGYKSPNEKLNIASIAAGGKARTDIRNCAETENIVALADPDSDRASEIFSEFSDVPKYKDFREMLDKEDRNIDAVLVSTPDHMHGMQAMWAMERGKHVYCQKPLTRTVWEARELTKAAEKYGVATQMGNQGYSNDGAREASELIWSGVIGDVQEVHSWTNRPIWPQGVKEVPKGESVPSTMDWDSWIGIADMRPYSPAYAPHNWRGWYDFGCGALGDMACHILGSVNMALLLTAPTQVKVLDQVDYNPHTFSTRSSIRFDFPARKGMPPVKIFWYDGAEEAAYVPDALKGKEVIGYKEDDIQKWAQARNATKAQIDARRKAQQANGSMFIGTKGILTTDTYADNVKLFIDGKEEKYEKPNEWLTRSPGHYRDFIRAAKGGDPACSNFSVAGPFTEWILLGALALRLDAKLDWNVDKMKTNSAQANDMLKPTFRKGWSFT